MSPKPVIYISSTFYDLEEHRKRLIDAFQKTRLFDVRCMEYYGTISRPALQQCLNDVEASEFYILLLGSRYGYIPAGEKFSITNLEYKKAINDNNPDEVASVPNSAKCILPFLLHEHYKLNEKIYQAITDEEQQEGEQVTNDKNAKLEKLKLSIQSNFVLDNRFTTPEDLLGKVLGAILPELVNRNYASLLPSLKLNDEIAYRCNREYPRNQFLQENYGLQGFIKVFIIHGEPDELPGIFTFNISHYELKIKKGRYININNLKFKSNIPEKFLISFALELHRQIFKDDPKGELCSLEFLFNKIYDSNEIDNVAVRIEISYNSWKENNKYIELLFQEIKRLDKSPSNKSFYLLFNITYREQNEIYEATQQTVVLIDKLEKINIKDIESWIITYLFSDTSNDSINMQRAILASRKITELYFPAFHDTDDEFCMEDAIDILLKIINDFNTNQQLFTNYDKLYR